MSNPDLYWTFAILAVALVIYGLRHRIKRWGDRREAAKRDQRKRDARNAQDPLAHYYLTVEEINAQTPVPESFQRFGRTIWRFGGKNYLDAAEADEARRQAVLKEARSFYQDIDRLRLGRH